jgi:hypothetical protein
MSIVVSELLLIGIVIFGSFGYRFDVPKSE